MAKKAPLYTNVSQEARSDLVMLAAVLLLSFLFLHTIAGIAFRPPPTWQVQTDMLSRLVPEVAYAPPEEPFRPLRPEVLALPPVDVEPGLTQSGPIVTVPPVVFSTPTVPPSP
ncbi:MAG TPA: hypothetical protein G4O00_08925, partial [Thermoflexia bacterium]|nr:hypothetical protein [Thermoflexia bacterium]